MSKLFDVNSIIVAAQNADLTKHAYNEIYGGSAGCTMTVNGIALSVGPSSNLNIVIQSVSGGSGCFLLGENLDVANGSTLLGG